MNEQYFYGHGKLLLTGEYFVLDGANAIALPSHFGQKMYVKTRPSSHPKIYWKSYDNQNACWLECSFDFWHFDSEQAQEDERVAILQNILRQARKQNIHFLRDEVDVYVSTHLEFPVNWGLGSSSTLVYNIAQWAYISPFELLSQTFPGSGYDIACAQSMGPICYQLKSKGPYWETQNFNPHFKNGLFFVYLNQKQNSKEGVEYYKNLDISNKEVVIKNINRISQEILDAVSLKEFEELILEHENLISQSLGLEKVQDKLFSDYWGVVKSLGAWGGDFVLVTSKKSLSETKEYFSQKGYTTFLTFDELILQNFQFFDGQNSGEDNKNVSIG